MSELSQTFAIAYDVRADQFDTLKQRMRRDTERHVLSSKELSNIMSSQDSRSSTAVFPVAQSVAPETPSTVRKLTAMQWTLLIGIGALGITQAILMGRDQMMAYTAQSGRTAKNDKGQ